MTIHELDLAAVTVDTFQPLLGKCFDVALDRESEPVTQLRLTDVEKVKHSVGPRQGFSLMFEGPASASLSQGMFWLSEAETGGADIFIVPVGAKDDIWIYQAVFN